MNAPHTIENKEKASNVEIALNIPIVGDVSISFEDLIDEEKYDPGEVLRL